MEKISLSEILLMNPRLNLSQLKGFRYFAIDRNGDKFAYEKTPEQKTTCWVFAESNALFIVDSETECENWKESLREIDFTNSEPESSQEIECLIKQTSDWLMKNSKLDVELIVDLSDYLRKINL